MMGAHIIMMPYRNNGNQTYMQNNMQTVHVGICHLFQKQKKNMLGIKTLILLVSLCSGPLVSICLFYKSRSGPVTHFHK